MTLFSLLHKLLDKTCKLSHKVSHLPFVSHFTRKIIFLPFYPQKFTNFFLLVSLLEMVSPGTAPAPSAPASRRHCIQISNNRRQKRDNRRHDDSGHLGVLMFLSDYRH